MIFKYFSIGLLNTLFSCVLSFTDVCSDGELLVETEPKYLISPNWPSNYDDNLNCYKTLNAGKNQRVAFSLVEAQFESTIKMYDYVELYDGLQRDTRMTYFTSLRNEIVTSRNQYMGVHFRSDGSNNQKGFKAKVYIFIETSTTSPEVRFTGLLNNITDLRNETFDVIKNNDAKNEAEREKLKEEIKAIKNVTNLRLQNLARHFETELNKTSNLFKTELESRNEIIANFSETLNSLTSQVKASFSENEAKFNSSENFKNQTETKIQENLRNINTINQNQIYNDQKFITFEGNMTLALQEMRSDFILHSEAKNQFYLLLSILTTLLVSFLCLIGICKRFVKTVFRNPSPPIMVNNDIYNL